MADTETPRSGGHEDGLRDRKKRQTREAIAAAAARLFAKHGFDAVTTDDVAREADVSRQTVFNYFPTKEALLFDREDEVREALVRAVRERPADKSLVEVFREHTRRFWQRLHALVSEGPLRDDFWGIVESSPALRNHAEVIFARHAAVVAAVLAEERKVPYDDPACHAIARALCGVNSAVLTTGLHRMRLADRKKAPAVAKQMLKEADRAYDLLRDGFGDL
jgi:AcrR family transcriptional regulator